MTSSVERADSLPMSKEVRGEALRVRMVGAKLNPTSLAKKTGIDRGTVMRALAGTSKEDTLAWLEQWFEREERKNNPDMAEFAQPAPPPQHVIIRMEEGGALVVEGPVDTPEQREILKEFARDLMRERDARGSDD